MLDSEDEEEVLDTPVQLSAAANSTPDAHIDHEHAPDSLTTAETKEADTTHLAIFDLPDSPSSSELSDIDSIILSPEPGRIIQQPTVEIRPLSPRLLNYEEQDQLRHISPEYVDNTWVVRKNLRKRTALQQNPYTVEGQYYRHLVKESGIRPVQVVNKSQDPNVGEEGKDDEFGLGDGSQERSFHRIESSSPTADLNALNRASSVLQSGVPSTAPSSVNDEDAIPAQRSMKPKKRQKLTHLSTKSRIPQARPSDLSHGFSEDEEIYNLSQSPSPVESGGLFRPPPSLPSFLQKPQTGQDNAGISIAENGSDTQSDNEANEIRQPSRRVIESSSDDSDRVVPEENKAQQIKRDGKRLAGVLPASYVTLDMAKQKQREILARQRQKKERRKQQAQQVRGVARHIVSKPYADVSKASVSPSPEDTEGRSESSSSPIPKAQHASVHADEGLSSDPGSDMEYDAIDLMGPARNRQARPRPSVGTSRKRNKSIKSYLSKPEVMEKLPPSKKQTGVVSELQQRRNRSLGTRPNKQTFPQRKVSSLSILDFPESSMRCGTEMPLFLRIARRQARTHPKLARRSPSKRYIQLQTREDTADANEMLQKWRNGEYEPGNVETPRKKTSRPHPNTLTISSGNRQISFKKNNGKIPFKPQPRGLQGIIHQHEETLKKQSQLKRKGGKPAGRVPDVFRPAQLESLESDFGFRNKKTAFEKTLRTADNNFALRKLLPGVADAEVARYLHDDESTKYDGDVIPSVEVTNEVHGALSKQPRKRIARHIDEVRAIKTRLPVDDGEQPSGTGAVPSVEIVPRSTLLGLTGSYSDTLNIYPLPHDPSSHFHAETFIGSGKFAEALAVNQRQLDQPNGAVTIDINSHCYSWSAWSEPMADDIRTIFKSHVASLVTMHVTDSPLANSQENYASALRLPNDLESIVGVFSQILYFTDDVDRLSFGSCMIEIAETLLKATFQCLCSIVPGDLPQKLLHDALFRSVALQTTLILQIMQITKEDVQIVKVLTASTELLGHALIKSGMPNLRLCLDRHSDRSIRTLGYGKDDIGLEAVVILHHLLRISNTPNVTIWSIINRQLMQPITAANRVTSLESFWRDIFTISSTLEIDVHGKAVIGGRFSLNIDDWSAVKAIIEKVFYAYQQQIEPSRAVELYLRAVLRRCHHLIEGWGWQRCETIVGVLFNFFGSQNKLRPLHFEEAKGSPSFLQMLDRNPSLDLDNADSAFGIFLKILGLAIRAIRRASGLNKAESLINRCTPNHSRQYLKEHAMDKVDSEALRNHHDLLCTLFWLSSNKNKRRTLSLLRGLVDHSLSHRSSCQSSMRAWANLIRYQLAVSDEDSLLNEFALWQKDILGQAMQRYNLIVADVTEHYSSKDNSDGHLNLDGYFRKNFSSVFEILENVVFALKAAMKTAKSQSQVARFLEASGVEELFKLSSDIETRAAVIMGDGLEVYKLFLTLPMETTSRISQNKDESQDYGDWPEEFISIDFIQKPLFQFMSNYFGLDSSVADFLGRSLIQTWITVLQTKTQRGELDWSVVLGSYGEYSWARLNETRNKRKFTGFFYASILQADKRCLADFRQELISTWLVALVERDSLLNFQHLLTSTLLNCAPDDELFQNLPFWKDKKDKYNISLDELRSRRLSLMSSVFSNMQRIYEYASHSVASRESTKQLYSKPLQEMMKAMKSHFRELKDGNHTKDKYVMFVHEIIGFLHRYTVTICPVDDFFTRSTDFPLPTQDPNYVVSKLRGYEGKLKDKSGMRQLFHFFTPLCERAVLENRSELFSEQLKTSMSQSSAQNGLCLLRDGLLQTIFPSYIKLALSTEAGWIVCAPILPVLEYSLRNILFTFNPNEEESMVVASDTILIILSSLQESAQQTIIKSASLKDPQVLQLLAWYMRIVSASLSPLDYIQRITRIPSVARECISFFKEFSKFCARMILDMEAWTPQFETPPECSAYQTVRAYFTQSLTQSLNTWKRVGKDYFHTSAGGRCRQVPVVLRTMEEEKKDLIHAIEDFHHGLSRMPGL